MGLSSRVLRGPEHTAPGARAEVREVELSLGRCELSCVFCDDRFSPWSEVDRALHDRASRVVLRGSGVADDNDLARAARLARERGAVVVARTHALDAARPERARRFVASGVDVALVPLFSSSSAVHDRIARRDGALSMSLAGMRALSDAGAAIEIEAPILSPRLQSLAAIVTLARRAVPLLRAVRFYAPTVALPAVLAPPGWDVTRAGLAEGVRRCRELGVDVRLRGSDGVPLCALRDAPELLDAYRFHPRRALRLAPGASHPPVCDGCAAKRQCPGVTHATREAHGDAGLEAYKNRPLAMYAQRSPGAPRFTAEHRRLAAETGTLVLRPTVHCNQDCTFCSANETSNNVWEDPGAMLRTIARAARRNVRRVSFGGGEPTLSRDLPHYVSAARRLGVPSIELVTNAVLLDREARVATLREAGLTHAFVSLHAHDERLSQSLTRKVGDHARTVQGIRNLLAAGVETWINHVITTRNSPYLTSFVEFVRASFGGRTTISFALMTPQYKGLEDLSQMPRIGDVMPELRRALRRAIALEQPVQIGSRQGIPPCMLGPFRAWSDALEYTGEPAAEDAPQKLRAPGCDGCRYTRHCAGLWRPYVDRYGLDEMIPVRGDPFTDDELAALHTRQRAYGRAAPLSFEEAHPLLRDLSAEAETRDETAPPAPPIRALPVLSHARSRPLRAVMAGTGRRARLLAREARGVPGLSIEAVASPHAREVDLGEFASCPGFTSLEEALDEMRPEAVIVAASTAAHYALTRAALARGLPVLIEKPVTRTVAEAEALARLDDSARVVVAYPTRFAAGLDAVLSAPAGSRVEVVRRVTSQGPGAMPAWSRDALGETLHHAIALAGHALPGTPRVRDASYRGERAPERVRVLLDYDGDAEALIELDFTASFDETQVTRRARAEEHPRAAWRRRGPHAHTELDGVEITAPRSGSDVQRMLAHFRAVALGEETSKITLAEGLRVLVAVHAALDALDAAGAPFERAESPRHARSRLSSETSQ